MGISKKLASKVSAFFLLVGVISISLSGGAYAAGSATLTITPSSGTYKVGDVFRITINENSGTVAVNAVQADLTYNTSLLQYVSTDVSSGAFTTVGTSTGGSGAVTLGVASLGTSKTNSQNVAVVTFKAIGVGSAAINFASSSAIVNASNQNNELGNRTGANFAITSSNPTTTTTTPTPKTTSTTAPKTSTSTSTTNTTPSASTPGSNTTGSTPSSQPGVQGESAERYMVAIKVLDENNKIVIGAKVTLDDMTAISDSTGIASFPSVPAGEHTLKTTINGKTKSQLIDVKGVSSSIPEEFSIQLSKESFLQANIKYIALAVGGLLVLIVLWILWRKLRTPKDHHMDGAPIISGPVSGSDSAMPPPMPNVAPLTNQNVGTVYQPVKSSTVVSTNTTQNNDSTTGAQ